MGSMYNSIIRPRATGTYPERLMADNNPVAINNGIVCVHSGEKNGLIHTNDTPGLAIASIVKVTLPVSGTVAAAVFHIFEVLDYQLGKLTGTLYVCDRLWKEVPIITYAVLRRSVPLTQFALVVV